MAKLFTTFQTSAGILVQSQEFFLGLLFGRSHAPFNNLKTNHLVRCKFFDQSHSSEEGVDALLFLSKKLAEFGVEHVFLLVLFRPPVQKWKNIFYCLY